MNLISGAFLLVAQIMATALVVLRLQCPRHSTPPPSVLERTDLARDQDSPRAPVRSSSTAQQVNSRQAKTDLFNLQSTSTPFRTVQPNASAVYAPGERPTPVSEPNRSVICHTFTKGRLGNHLFEYASILGIAETTGKSVFFSNADELRDVLKNPGEHGLRVNMESRCRLAETLRESHGCQYDRRLIDLEPGKDYDIGDYLQSWMYFYRLRDEVRKALTFTDEIVRNATRVVDSLKLEFPDTTLVGIHVRRGDLAATDDETLRAQGYLTAPADFFQRSMAYFRRRFPNVTFIVLGEDREWSTAHIPPVDNDVVVLEPNSPAVDMQILSMTDHMIRTVGTFGWWAAFKMAGRPTVVYLKDFVKKDSWISGWYTSNALDFVLPSWLPM